MRANHLYQLLILISLLFNVESLDNNTLSNYKDIPITNLTGIFKPNFENEIVEGNLTFYFKPHIKGSQIILDTKNLEIKSINDSNGTPINYRFGNENKNLGIPLIIEYEYEANSNISLNIIYSTTKEGSAAQFLSKEQTLGKNHPYFFTMSALINGRQLLPSQDTPAVKFPFYLGITVKKELKGMISGLLKKEEDDGEYITYYYSQQIPVPTYLIGLVAGNIVEGEINDNISVYSEPEFVEEVKKELNDLPDILYNASSYMGNYEWGKYNVLVLPRSFPYSGMENPCLSFCSPCLINGDKSLVDIVVHELIHSWSGNLVTNENWRDFWLNEGITMFLQRKIISMWKGVDYSKMDGILGLSYIDEYLDIFGNDSTYTTLRPNFDGVSPDDFFSDIPYEKGYNLIYYIESLVGEDINMKDFFQSYFARFKYQSIDVYDFINYFNEYCRNRNISEGKLDKIKWEEWLYKPGKCPVENNFTNIYQEEVDNALENFNKGKIDDDLANTIKKWKHTSKTVFMRKLNKRDDFLTFEQHNFLTNTLKLYEEDFLVSTNYFRLILKQTDEFFEIELESLIKYLSNYGALDYMVGIYGEFYKRDEIKAEETLNNLKSFYHKLMFNMASDEIKTMKESFPILTIELKDKCLCLNNSEKLDYSKLLIISNEYKEELGNLTISEIIKLEVDNETIGVKCYLNAEEKYCLLDENITKPGEYMLSIPKRIQKKKYAIKVHNSTIKYYFQELEIDTNLTNASYEIDYGNEEKYIIKLYFINGPNEKVRVLNNGKEINCTKNKLFLQCEISNDVLEVNKKNPKKYTQYTLNVEDFCGINIYTFNISVKNSNDGLEFGTLLIIVIGSLLFIIISTFIIYRCTRKDKEINIDETKEERILNDL